MAEQLGRLSAQPGNIVPKPPDNLLALINQRIAPTQPLTDEQVYVACMYLVSDQVNSFGGKFPTDEHDRIAALLIDSPVIVGHRKDQLPIGRTFHAELVERDGRNWVKSSFYWLRSVAGAEDLKDNIEGGVYKECSIAFTYSLPECSICGHDIRICEHEPFQEYTTSSGPSQCHFNYRQIERVLESSLVYRGAVPDTLVTRETENQAVDATPPEKLTILDHLSRLDPDRLYVVVPRYDSLPVVAGCSGGSLSVRRFDGVSLGARIIEQLCDKQLENFASRPALLVGYHGKERCRLSDLERYLANQSGPVSRLVLALYPDTRNGVRVQKRRGSLRGLRTLPYRISSGAELHLIVPQIASRSGVEIWPFEAKPLFDTGFAFSGKSVRERRPKTYRFNSNPKTGQARLTIRSADTTSIYIVSDFDRNLLNRGARFVADLQTDVHEPEYSPHALSGLVNSLEVADTSMRLSLSGPLGGDYIIRPITIGGQSRFLFSRLLSPQEKREVSHV
ncbi:MAG: hypothetical protein HY851_00680 [candidate division Zixibacteria bacterium]|nr:hypothetical protein [candidate division Zixibacteria bacterium]